MRVTRAALPWLAGFALALPVQDWAHAGPNAAERGDRGSAAVARLGFAVRIPKFLQLQVGLPASGEPIGSREVRIRANPGSDVVNFGAAGPLLKDASRAAQVTRTLATVRDAASLTLVSP
jgi:hypothetical protein